MSCVLQGVTSYVIVRPLCTALALITSQFGVYSEGDLTPNKAYPYLAMATNLSQVGNGLHGCCIGILLHVAAPLSAAVLVSPPSACQLSSIVSSVGPESVVVV
jgi:hypothetical protein